MKRTALLLAAATVVASPAMAFDLDAYAARLTHDTRAVADAAGTRVDYAALRSDPAWRAVVSSLEAADPWDLEGANALAFWINAYNVLAVDWIVREGPVETIRDLGNLFRPVWKKPAGRIGGREVTLDEIEHRILRPMGEPRIHFAIVCASTSCPSLRREPFRAADLDRQLDEQTRAFLADPRKGLAIERGPEDVRLSKIFDWFAEDFGKAAGIVAFVTEHAPEADRPWLRQYADEMDLLYLPYDWEVNALPGRR